VHPESLRVGQPGQPADQVVGENAREGPHRGGPSIAIHVVPDLELVLKGQQPRPAIGAFECLVVGIGEECVLGLDVVRGEERTEGFAGVFRRKLVREETQESDDDPLHLDAGVPVETAVKRGMELPMGGIRTWPGRDEVGHCRELAGHVRQCNPHVVGGDREQQLPPPVRIETHRALRQLSHPRRRTAE
jgi:hypothetical protein